jgi:glycosyltransferase involved in cell wall biosynthesis
VTLCSVYDDSVNLELVHLCEVPIVYGIDNLPECDVVIVPSDSDQHQKIVELDRAKKRILFKLGHNARFKVLEEQGLNGNYDAVLTATEWLKEATEHVQKGWEHDEQPATRVGWYNHEFKTFATPPHSRQYHKYGGSQIVIGGLIHPHPLKGSNDLMSIFQHLNQRHGKLVKLIGVGETEAVNRTNWFQYFYKPSRKSFSELLSQVDVWVNCSHTEGLGRLCLEAMSAGCVIVASDTGCEYMEDGANCLTFPVGDRSAAVEQVEKAFKDEKLFTQLAINGFKTAEAYADPGQYGDNLVAAIEEVLK